MTYWEHLSSTTIDAVDRSVPVILPLGAVEQHGPHLPLATDRLLADHFCRRLDDDLGDRVLILPTVSVGYSRHHDDFPGTLSVSHETFLRQVVETAGSALRLGMRTLLLVNAHGGNEGVGQVALEQLGYSWPDRTVARTTWWQVAAPELLAISETGPGGVGHACEFETSLLMAVAPHLVDAEAIPKRENVAAFDWDTTDMLRRGPATLYQRFSAVSPTGVFGEPLAASADKGERMSAVISERLADLVRSLGTEVTA